MVIEFSGMLNLYIWISWLPKYSIATQIIFNISLNLYFQPQLDWEASVRRAVVAQSGLSRVQSRVQSGPLGLVDPRGWDHPDPPQGPKSLKYRFIRFSEVGPIEIPLEGPISLNAGF